MFSDMPSLTIVYALQYTGLVLNSTYLVRELSLNRQYAALKCCKILLCTSGRNNPDANYVNWYHWFYLKEFFVPLQWYHFCWAFNKRQKRVVAILNGNSTSIDEIDPKLPDIMPQ